MSGQNGKVTGMVAENPAPGVKGATESNEKAKFDSVIKSALPGPVTLALNHILDQGFSLSAIEFTGSEIQLKFLRFNVPNDFELRLDETWLHVPHSVYFHISHSEEDGIPDTTAFLVLYLPW